MGAAPRLIDESAIERAAAELERVRELTELTKRMRSLQRTTLAGTTLESTGLATLPALAPLLPGGALQPGAVYGVAGSLSLVMGLLAGPSADGAWCAVVGVPEFGAEAAARFGVALPRLALVPEPGAAWLSVTAALADALTVVVVRPAERVSDADASRFAARLRRRGCTLIVVEGAGSGASLWPGALAGLSVVESSWNGITMGHGYPLERTITVRSEVRGGRARSASLRVAVAGVAAIEVAA